MADKFNIRTGWQVQYQSNLHISISILKNKSNTKYYRLLQIYELFSALIFSEADGTKLYNAVIEKLCESIWQVIKKKFSSTNSENQINSLIQIQPYLLPYNISVYCTVVSVFKRWIFISYQLNKIIICSATNGQHHRTSSIVGQERCKYTFLRCIEIYIKKKLKYAQTGKKLYLLPTCINWGL